MRIDTHEGLVADPAAPADVVKAVARLTDPAKAFVVVSETSPGETYLQAAGTLDDGFIIEYRDGSAGEHYRGDGRFGPGLLTKMLIVYMRGEASWRDMIAWHRVIIDGPRPAA